MADEGLVRLKQLQWRDEPSGALQTLVRPYAFELTVSNYPSDNPQDQNFADRTLIGGRILLLGYDDYTTLAAKKQLNGTLIELQATVIEEDDTSKLITINQAMITQANIIAGNKAKIKELGEANKAIVEYRFIVITSNPYSVTIGTYITIT
jgi:hypothetical protein